MPIVDITIMEGRSEQEKRDLYRKMTDAIYESIGAPKETIRILVREVPPFHFVVAGEPKGNPGDDVSSIG